MINEFNHVTLSENEHENILVQKMSQHAYTGTFNPQLKPNSITGKYSRIPFRRFVIV